MSQSVTNSQELGLEQQIRDIIEASKNFNLNELAGSIKLPEEFKTFKYCRRKKIKPQNYSTNPTETQVIDTYHNEFLESYEANGGFIEVITSLTAKRWFIGKLTNLIITELKLDPILDNELMNIGFEEGYITFSSTGINRRNREIDAVLGKYLEKHQLSHILIGEFKFMSVVKAMNLGD